MILRWVLFSILDILLLPVWFIAAPILSLFTAKGWPKWGSLFWTYDNPSQGDLGWQTKRSYFPNTNDRLKLYCNRVGWLWRNPGYGYQKFAGVLWGEGYLVTIRGNPQISDKYKRPGKYFATCQDKEGNLVAFEFYCVFPYSESRCFRCRLGWKIVTDKFQSRGFAPLVNTFNPLDGYGD